MFREIASDEEVLTNGEGHGMYVAVRGTVLTQNCILKSGQKHRR